MGTAEAELLPSVADGFSLAATGDCLATRPLAPTLERDPGSAEVVALLRGATVAFGNMETSILDIRGFTGAPRTVEDWGMFGPPSVATDLAALGFRLMSRANNHAMDWGAEGMRETGRHADAAGIVHAGAGERLANARAPRYVETPKGRVGLVSMVSMPRWDQDAALDPFGEVPGRPGVNALRLQRTITVPPAALEALQELARTMEPWAEQRHAEVSVLDSRFVEGPAVEVHHEPDPDDLRQILRASRLGKQHADALVVSAHIHEEGPDAATPPPFLVDLARATIDAGADVFVGHGVHRLWPVEMHAGRPILYGLGNFIWSDLVEGVHGGLFASAHASGAPLHPHATDADVNATLAGYVDDGYSRSVVAEAVFGGGTWELRLHPIDLGLGGPLTNRGIPRTADPETAAAILKHLQTISEPFGTTVVLQDGIGIVRA